MPTVAVLGCGPAGVAAALRLRQLGHAVVVFGELRSSSAREGVSRRVIDGFGRLGCALEAELGRALPRVSCWNGRQTAINREHVVERRALDRMLFGELRRQEVAQRNGRVAAVEALDGRWRITIDAAGERQSLVADFIVEARGAAAPRSAVDELAAPPALALCGDLENVSGAEATTVTESFCDGWAWCVFDGAGRAHLQLIVDAGRVRERSGDLAAVQADCLRHLTEIPRRLGAAAQAVGKVAVRGIRPGLRGGIVGARHIRVGDAAMRHDPLSGHGMFEAVSAAFAAAPVVNTLLRRPQDGALAQAFYRRRCRERCAHNLQLGAQLYRAEQRWPDAEFWQRRAALVPVAGGAAQPARRALIEDGFIVERVVIVDAEHPQGVRFVGPVELARLHAALATAARPPSAASTAARLGVDTASLLLAWAWLAQRQLARWPAPA